MGKARHELTDPVNARAYHMVSRCVRREHLMGHDVRTGLDFSHRRSWLAERTLALGDLFAVEVHALAVMGNHFHLVLQEDPLASLGWDAAPVASRHVAAFPPRTPSGAVDEARIDESIELLLDSRVRMARARRTLGTMSGYMKHLKQPSPAAPTSRRDAPDTSSSSGSGRECWTAAMTSWRRCAAWT